MSHVVVSMLVVVSMPVGGCVSFSIRGCQFQLWCLPVVVFVSLFFSVGCGVSCSVSVLCCCLCQFLCQSPWLCLGHGCSVGFCHSVSVRFPNVWSHACIEYSFYTRCRVCLSAPIDLKVPPVNSVIY